MNVEELASIIAFSLLLGVSFAASVWLAGTIKALWVMQKPKPLALQIIAFLMMMSLVFQTVLSINYFATRELSGRTLLILLAGQQLTFCLAAFLTTYVYWSLTK